MNQSADPATKGNLSHADETRHEILRHAKDLFTYYGFNKTNIGDIAERSGMSPGNLYRYYKNKQAIGVAVVEVYFQSVEAAMGTPLLFPEGTAEQRIRNFLEAGIKHLVDEIQVHPKIVELADFLCNDEEGLKLLEAHIGWKCARLAEEISKGIEKGELEPCHIEAAARTPCLSLKAFWMPMTLAQWRDPDTIMPEMRSILDLMFRGLRKR